MIHSIIGKYFTMGPRYGLEYNRNYVNAFAPDPAFTDSIKFIPLGKNHVRPIQLMDFNRFMTQVFDYPSWSSSINGAGIQRYKPNPVFDVDDFDRGDSINQRISNQFK